METPMTFTQELIDKHIHLLWNNPGCPVVEILGDIIRETLERAARECESMAAQCPKETPACHIQDAAHIRALKDKS